MMEKFQLTVFPGAPTEVCVLMCLDFFVFGNQLLFYGEKM